MYTHLEQLADQIVTAGIRQVPGGIVGDDSRYDDRRQVDGWSPGYVADGDVGPMSALEVNDGNRTLAPRRPSDDPAVSAATILTDLLVARGVQVGAPVTGHRARRRHRGRQDHLAPAAATSSRRC